MKGERPDFVVLTVINEELEAVRKVFEEKTDRKFKQRINPNHPVSAAFLELEISEQKVFLVKPTDKGNTPAATLTRAIIDHWNPRYLLIVGIGGGVKDVGKLCGGRRRESGLKIGDVVFSKSIYFYDYRNIEGGQEDVRPPTIEPPSENLREIAQSISQNWEYNGSRVKEGIILTGNKVINDPNYAGKIVCPYFRRESVLVFETEAGGVARAVYDLINEKKPSFLVIRGISDFVDDPEGGKERKNNRKRAAEAAAAFAYELIRTIEESELEKRRENLQPYLDEAKRLFEEKNPVDGKALKEYYVPPTVVLTDKETWDKKDKDIHGRTWDFYSFLEDPNVWYIVIGAPFGMGKTAYVKHISYELSTNFTNLGYVPLFVRLKEWDEKEINENLVTIGNKLILTIIKRIEEADAKPLLILDGLDEFNGSPRSIYRWITKLHSKCPPLKVIITTRLNSGVPQDLHFKKYVRLMPFGRKKVDTFFKKYGINEMNFVKAKQLGLDYEDIKKPLFCWMIALTVPLLKDLKDLLIIRGKPQEDRSKKTALFYYILTHLILKGKLKKNLKEDLSFYQEEKRFLRLTAAFMNMTGSPVIHQNLMEWIEAMKRHPRSLPDGGKIEPILTSYFYVSPTTQGKAVEFIHKSFQDYFLAEYYYEHICEGKMEMLNVGIPSEESIHFLKGLVEISKDTILLRKLENIDEQLIKFFNFKNQSKNAKRILEDDSITFPIEEKFEPSILPKENPKFMSIHIDGRVFRTLWIHRWIALVSLGDERLRKQITKETIENLIRYSSHLVPYWLKSVKNLNLEGVNISEANLTWANLYETILDFADLSEAKLVNADLRGARLQWANFTWTDLSRADLSNSYPTKANFINANLSEADLSKAHLEGANLSMAKLIKAKLRGAHLEGADLSEADLREANLTNAHLDGANLTKANLTQSKLIKTELSWADLSEADLTEANLSRAVFNETDLTKTNLTRTNLTDIVIKSATWDIHPIGLDTVILGKTPREILKYSPKHGREIQGSTSKGKRRSKEGLGILYELGVSVILFRPPS